ncbi:MAG: SGNH/GDSL hydrolase family protein [Kiritimatiellia bacterium]|nr:SGNH/GDSL hydrolase family protein [Kiritimatiellia bacterium]
MIHQNVELHNVAETTPRDGGVALQRVPGSLRAHLNEGAQFKVMQPGSGEIRFALDRGAGASVTLSTVPSDNWGEETAVTVFFGDYRHDMVTTGPDPVTIEIGWSEQLLACYDEVLKIPHAFSPNVVRLMMRGAQVVFHRAEGTGVRPPTRDELPGTRYLAYGTSITHGAAASAPYLSYAAQTARHLGADLLNFGVDGSCQAEKEFADYFASRDDWDIASLALSVNMMGFEEDEFARRIRYMVHTVAGAHPDKPVGCITLYPYFGDLKLIEVHNPAKAERFRQILRDAVRDCPTPNAHLIEGPDILQTFTGHTTDLIHPADDGMIEMGRNLAAALSGLMG